MNALSSADSNYLNADVLRLGEDIEEEDVEEEEDVSSDPEEEDEDEGEETEEEEEEDSRHSVPPRIANAKDNADQARAPAHTACTTPGHTHFHPLALAQVCDYPMCAFKGEALQKTSCNCSNPHCPNATWMQYLRDGTTDVGETSWSVERVGGLNMMTQAAIKNNFPT